MSRVKLCIAVSAACFLMVASGCGPQGGGGTGAGESHVLGAVGGFPGDIPVYVIVLTDVDSRGNEYFSEEYARNILDRASEYVKDRVKFVLVQLTRVPVDDYETNQLEVFLRYHELWAARGFVTVVISQPYTTDSAGRSQQYDWHQTTAPFLVMRSRNPWRERFGDANTLGVFAPVGSAVDIQEGAQIFLHEFGHNMGVGHHDINNPSLLILTQGQFSDPRNFNTENYYLVDQEFVFRFGAKLQDARRR